MRILQQVFANTRRPAGLIGKLMVSGMNSGDHAKLAKWGLRHITLRGDEAVLDCGCGGGANVKKFLKLAPRGKVTGLDYSEVSVAKSLRVNAEAIAAGRCEIVRGSVEKLPFADGSFDVASAFETVYFWPGLTDCFKEVCRVLKPGGFFLIVNEADGKHEKTLRWTKIIDGMTVYTGQQLKTALQTAGFSNVEVDDDEANDRLTIIARK